MDISKLNTTKASNKPKSIKLRNPYTNEILKDENDEFLEIDLLGISSDVAKNASAEQKRKQKKDISDEQSAQIGAEFLAKLTTGWRGNFEMGDEKLEFNYDNAVKLYLSEDWIARQCLDFVTNIRNYDPNA